MSHKFRFDAWVMFNDTNSSVPKEGRRTAWDWEPCLFLAASTQPRWTAHSSCPCLPCCIERTEKHIEVVTKTAQQAQAVKILVGASSDNTREI